MPNEAVEVAPFDLHNQKEQWRHLQTLHNVPWGRLTSKSRKAEFEKWHDEQHLHGSAIRVEHAHTAVAGAAATDADSLDFDVTQPLNTSQRRALKELVDNDFLALKAEIVQFADDMARQRREELKAEYKAKGADASSFVERANALASAYRSDCDALVIEARRAGVELSTFKLDNYHHVESKVAGLTEALKAADDEVNTDRKRALNTLERARLTAQRKVLMSGVNTEALAILDTIPDARSLMLQAAAQRTAPAGALASG